ncbi:hypothetical protein [Agromyces sp. NPDC058126]|uniref:hypothetical protein n=1 Tax=Agromyces sp. NPDC058126 TaxID=3346350 RepID=UPI0036DD5CAE
MKRRKLSLLAAAGVVVAGAVALVGGPAFATGSGADLSHNGVGAYTDMTVYGGGSNITSVNIGHNDMTPGESRCGRQAKFTGKLTDGTSYSSTYGYTASCTILPWGLSRSVNKNFVMGTNVTGQMYHDGAWAPGWPTVRIS